MVATVGIYAYWIYKDIKKLKNKNKTEGE